MKRKAIIYFVLTIISVTAISQVHTTYLWHLQQPIYWPDQSVWDANRYQSVWESQWRKDNAGESHPQNDLYDIFGKADRVAVYQYRCKDAVQTLNSYAEGGAQVNYSGCLIENINSLADASQMGYYDGWEGSFNEARSWTTSGGKPRMDIVGFTFHHALSPLLSERVLTMEIEAHKTIYANTFGISPNYSKGYWPAECSFSERTIKVLVEQGFEWTIIANSHLARTLNDYPLSYGTNACNIDPPNKADIVNTNGNNWWSGQIDGRGGTFAAPYCYQAHKAKYVDPNIGTEYKMTVVPMADVLSYQNGYGTMGTGDIDSHIAPYNDNGQPCIVLMAHDGDNAWGGGYDYYLNSVPGFAASAAGQGYVPSTIQQFLTDHPVPESDVVHVEDGSWVNAANDWGHPQFINWIWPMYDSNYDFDPNGWTEDVRNWAVLTAAENHVVMAEDLMGGVDINDIVYPSASSTNAEKAWHFLLPGYTSGYMYYGTSLDMEVKQTVAANNATGYANSVISANPGVDNTPPSVFIPQRYPYNPGGIGFGANYGYSQHQNSSDFFVWTFAYDVSGVQSAVLKYRVDFDGENPIADNQNEIYSGGSGVSSWMSLSMTEREFPTGNITGNPEIDFYILPDYIANEYYAEIEGLVDTLVDYYVEVTDYEGNVEKSPIQHVWVGNYSGGSSQDGVHWIPANPDLNDVITIIVPDATQGAKLHWGVNNEGSTWNTPDDTYWPVGSYLFSGSGPAIESEFDGPTDEELRIEIGPFNDDNQVVDRVSFVVHYNDENWDNNNGQDYLINIDNNPSNSIGNNLNSERKILVYPNPATNTVNIKVTANRNIKSSFYCEIINTNGQVVGSGIFETNYSEIDISKYENGVYFIKIFDSVNNQYLYEKLVVTD